MGDDIVKKKMIVLIAFIYIASMLFCGDGVGKKFVEEKFPHLTYSDKECDDSKKKELRIVEDEDTAGGILSYEELAAMENENASVRNNMLPDTDQLAFVDEAEKNGELAELEEQQNVKMPQVDMSFDNLVKNYYQVDKTTYVFVLENAQSRAFFRQLGHDVQRIGIFDAQQDDEAGADGPGLPAVDPHTGGGEIIMDLEPAFHPDSVLPPYGYDLSMKCRYYHLSLHLNISLLVQ